MNHVAAFVLRLAAARVANGYGSMWHNARRLKAWAALVQAADAYEVQQ